jgi:hypothetical protein
MDYFAGANIGSLATDAQLIFIIEETKSQTQLNLLRLIAFMEYFFRGGC